MRLAVAAYRLAPLPALRILTEALDAAATVETLLAVPLMVADRSRWWSGTLVDVTPGVADDRGSE